MRGPVDRLSARLPAPWATVVDWVVTIVVAVGAVLAIKAWVVNPYRIPSPSMEPTLHCAVPQDGCLARFSDRVLANRFIYHFREPRRNEIVVFDTPDGTEATCAGHGGTFVKRLVGLPGDRVVYRDGELRVNGELVSEPYIDRGRDGGEPVDTVVPADGYFMMGDNRAQSCDSREWGTVPRENLIGPVFAVYWPPQRVSVGY